MKKIIFLLIASYTLYSCNDSANSKDAAGSFNMDSVKAAIEANNKTFMDAVKNGDSLAFIGSYTTDGCIMPEGSPSMCGAKGLADFYTWARQMGLAGLVFKITEISGGKDLVSEEGTYEAMHDGNVVEKGKYLVTWKQENGKWKKYRDIFNSDAPPQPMPVVKK